MIAYLKKVSADDKKIIYRYSYLEPIYDGLITIDCLSGETKIELSGDEWAAMRMAKIAAGKIMLWRSENKLPDKYNICTG